MLKRMTLILTIVLSCNWTFACQSPSPEDAHAFFAGNLDWTLVNGPGTTLVNQSRDVDFSLNFTNPSRSIVNWNGGPARFRNLRVCKSDDGHTMTIRSNWPRVRLTRMRGGWLKATAVGINFYLYPSHRVAAE